MILGSVQDNIDNLVTNGEYNNAGLRRTLDSTDSGIFKTANPLSLFKNANKFDLQNPALDNLLAQIQAGQLSDKEVKRLLNEGETQKIEARLKGLKKFNKRNDDDNEDGDGGQLPGPSPPSDGSDRKPWRRKGPIRSKTPSPTKERVWWKHVGPQPPQPAVRPRPKPPPRPSKQRTFAPDQLIKEGLRKPEPLKKSDIPLFIDKNEDEDEDFFSKSLFLLILILIKLALNNQ